MGLRQRANLHFSIAPVRAKINYEKKSIFYLSRNLFYFNFRRFLLKRSATIKHGCRYYKSKRKFAGNHFESRREPDNDGARQYK